MNDFMKHKIKKDFERICHENNIAQKDVIEYCRIKCIVDKRAFVVKELRKRGYLYPQIAWVIKRDHSSVMNLAKRIDRETQII